MHSDDVHAIFYSQIVNKCNQSFYFLYIYGDASMFWSRPRPLYQKAIFLF